MFRFYTICYSLGFFGCFIALVVFLASGKGPRETVSCGEKKMKQIRFQPQKELYVNKGNKEYVHALLTAKLSTLDADSLDAKVKLQEHLEELKCLITTKGKNGQEETKTILADSGVLDYNKMTLDTLGTQMVFVEDSGLQKKTTLEGKAQALCIDFRENPPHFEARSFSGSYHAK